MGWGLTAVRGGRRRGPEASGRALGEQEGGAGGGPNPAPSWLSAETPGSRSCAKQWPPKQTTGWQPREERRSQDGPPHGGTAPGSQASHPPAARQHRPSPGSPRPAVAQSLTLCLPRLAPPSSQGASSCSRITTSARPALYSLQVSFPPDPLDSLTGTGGRERYLHSARGRGDDLPKVSPLKPQPSCLPPCPRGHGAAEWWAPLSCQGKSARARLSPCPWPASAPPPRGGMGEGSPTAPGVPSPAPSPSTPSCALHSGA